MYVTALDENAIVSFELGSTTDSEVFVRDILALAGKKAKRSPSTTTSTLDAYTFEPRGICTALRLLRNVEASNDSRLFG